MPAAAFFFIVVLAGIVAAEDCANETCRPEMTVTARFLADQKRLFYDLFSDYDATMPPIFTLYSSPYVTPDLEAFPDTFAANVDLNMLKLVSVSEPEEKVSFLFDYVASWRDERLTWDPMSYGGIEHVYVPYTKVWLPEISTVDAHDVVDYRTDVQKYCWIFSNGSVATYVATVTSVVCQMDIFKFPLDKQTCRINLLAHAFRNDEYVITTSFSFLPRPLEMLGNGEWRMKRVYLDEELIRDDNGTVVVTIKSFATELERNPAFYVALIMVPAFVVNTLSIIALFLNLENLVEKFTVGLTNIMSMTFILGILAADLPKTKNLPMLATFVLVNLALMVISICIVIVLPRIMAAYDRKKEKKLENNYQQSKFLYFFFEYVRFEWWIMLIIQIANIINFAVLFI